MPRASGKGSLLHCHCASGNTTVLKGKYLCEPQAPPSRVVLPPSLPARWDGKGTKAVPGLWESQMSRVCHVGGIGSSHGAGKPSSTCFPHLQWCAVLARRYFSPAWEINLVSTPTEIISDDELQSNTPRRFAPNDFNFCYLPHTPLEQTGAERLAPPNNFFFSPPPPPPPPPPAFQYRKCA